MNRTEGASLYGALLSVHGFQAVRTSSGKIFRTAEGLRAYIEAFPKNAYWGQVDIWVTKDAAELDRASPLIPARRAAYRNI